MTEQHNMHNRDKILEEMAEYICDKRCRYPYEAEQEELDAICEQCVLSNFIELLGEGRGRANGQENEKMGNTVIYEITNIKTGEKHVGTAEEMGKVFGVTYGHIHKLSLEGKRLRLDWKIERVGATKEVEKTNNGSIPYALQEEWDKVTAPFKKLSEKKASTELKQMGE